MMRELEHVNWNVITSNEKTSDEMLSKFYEVIYPLFEKYFPRIKVKLSTRDPPFMSPLIWSNTSLILGKKRSKNMILNSVIGYRKRYIRSFGRTKCELSDRKAIIIKQYPRNDRIQLIELRPGPNLTFHSVHKLIQVT